MMTLDHIADRVCADTGFPPSVVRKIIGVTVDELVLSLRSGDVDLGAAGRISWKRYSRFARPKFKPSDMITAVQGERFDALG